MAIVDAKTIHTVHARLLDYHDSAANVTNSWRKCVVQHFDGML